MIHHLITILKASPDVIAITTAARIFPLIRLQGSDVPALVLQLTGADPDDTKDRAADMETNAVQITAFAMDPATTWALMEAVRAALDGYTGGVIAELRFVNHASDVFETTEVFSITARYDCTIHRDGTTTPTALAAVGYPLNVRGALFLNVETVTATAGEAISIDPTDHFVLVDFLPDAAHGVAVVYLPPIAGNEGRVVRIKAGGNVDQQHRLRVQPYPGDVATIDGEPDQETDKPYCSATLIATGGAWYCIQIVNK